MLAVDCKRFAWKIGSVLVGIRRVWQANLVRISLQRCFVALGLLAMAMALVAIPAGIVLASAKSDMAAMAGTTDEMPCDHPCPGCAKPCPDMGSCLLNCFQQLSPAPAGARIDQRIARWLIPPALSRRIAEAPIPPLLRPPSV
jgi:hypothetical protein